MNSVYDLLKEIKKLGARIYVVDGQIKLDIKKGGLTAEISEKINYYKKDILELLGETSKRFEFTQIEKTAEQDSYPISDGQRRLWVLCQFGDASVAYNMPEYQYINQDIDIHIFKQAVTATIERHEILRTVFREDETGTARQWILKTGVLKPEIDYRDYRHEPLKQELVQSYIAQDSYKAFDLEHGPLLRISLMQLEDAQFVLYYNMHHIISDGWSMKVLTRDFFAYYEAYKTKKKPELNELRIQYKDYSAWQLTQVQDESFKAHKAYWLEHLKGELPQLDLPAIKRRPGVKSSNGWSLSTYIDSASATKLKTYAETNGGSLFMGLLTVWNILMYRYTNQQDIITGIPVAGREHADLADQIGFYINTLALRNVINPADRFDEIFERVKQNTLSAYTHQVYPFDRLVEDLHVIRNTSRSVVFDVLITFQNVDEKTQNLQLNKEEINTIKDLGFCTSKFDIGITFQEVNDCIAFNIVYNTDVYEKAMIKGLMHHYKQLLRAVLQHTDERITQVNYLSEEERHTLLVSFNNNPLDFTLNKTIIELIEAQTAQTPDAIAITVENRKLTYKELDERSNQLAHYLRQRHSIQPDDFVGIKQDRSEWMIISILAVLKSGGAYVPVDPAYPAARQAFILENTSVKVLLTQTDYIFDMEYYNGPLFAVDAQAEELNAFPVEALPPVKETALAYVIYTSGSTGKPKGCGITHANLSHYIQWANDYYFQENDKASFCLYTSLSFDLTVTSIYCTLTQGGSIKVYPQHMETAEILKDAFTNGSEINSIKLTPSHINLLQHLDLKRTSIERAIVGGEAVNLQHVKILKELNPYLKVYNEYGPTETTVGCIVKELLADEPVYIGKPMKGVQVYILSAEQELLPIGVPGEICISGKGVGQGYLNSPELNEEKFVPDPFIVSERMYRTGDIGRWLDNGEIEYLGRRDDQVKIRGYRVELGEIESQLNSHPAVSGAVVLAQTNSNNEQELVAYITSVETLDPAEIKNYLNKQLPAYQVPVQYVQVETIPLTVNGKVDKKQLQLVYKGDLLGRTEYVAPRNASEEKLVFIWQEILGKEKIGIRDNFFDLGGDSIKILRMMASMRRDLNMDTPIIDVYKYNTIESLHTYIYTHKEELESRSKTEKAAESQLREELESLKSRAMELLQSSGKNTAHIEDLYPMSDIEKGMVFESIVDTGKGIYHDQKVFQRKFTGFDPDCFEQALDRMIEKHAILRSSFHLEEFETEMKMVHRKIAAPYEYFDISNKGREAQELFVRKYMESDLEKPFVIDQAPLWRMTAFHFGSNEIIFVFQCHHAIIDGWSETSFVAEVNNIYLLLKENSAYRPDTLQSDYKDFIVEHELIRKNEDIRNFWKSELAETAKMNLFTPESYIQEYGGAIDDRTFKQLKNLAHKNNVSLKVISLTAYMQLLKMLNYDDEIIFGLVTNMRPSCEDSDKILGCFLNTIPFRMKVDGTKSGVAFMNEINEKLLSIKDKEKLSVLEIANMLEKGSAAGNPFFDVIFNYVDFHVLDSVKTEATDAEAQTEMVNLDSQVLGNTYLDFSVDITGGLYRVHISLTRRLKSRFTAEKIASAYFNILRRIIENPNAILNQIKLVTEEEEEQLLKVFNSSTVAHPPVEAMLSLFERQVRVTPDQAAIIYKDKTITYSELNAYANQLAHYLQNKGLKPDDLVAVKLSRCEWVVIAMLGILKSGAAYVAVDPLYPQSRIDYMLNDSNCKIVLDDVAVQAFEKQRTQYVSTDPASINSDTDLAYVIYTSGSTGLPKGVMITRQALSDYVATFAKTFDINEKDRVIQQSSFSFDTHVEEIYPVLTKGGTVLMAANGGSDIQELQQLLRQNATVLSATPVVLNELNALHPEINSLRLLISGGDAFNASSVNHFFGKLDIYDSYGPSECTVCSTYHRVTKLDTVAIIGKPIDNRSIYILSKENQLLPIGITGEICIAGLGLAKGYLGNPELTASKFVRNPFKPGSLMYRSGDLGRWLPDGSIEFIGRMDEQVKIRGYRIEKGEIENALQQHPHVMDAIVTVNTNAWGEKELVAYLVGSQTLDNHELRNYLNSVLPVYMIPTHFVQLERLPVTTNGKVDKKRLPNPESLSVSPGTMYMEPGNEMEAQLVNIWQEVLQKERISVNDDFFALGGHSLKAVRLRNQYQKKFSVTVSLKDLFEHTSIASHAAFLEASGKSEFIPIEKVTSQSGYPISDGQRRLWVLCQFEKSSVAYNMPASIVLDENIDLVNFRKAIDAVMDRHEILRTIFKEDETGEIRQWVMENSELGFAIAYKDFRKRTNKDDAVQRYISEDSAKAFDLEKGPLVRAGLLQIANNRFVFYFNMHHIIGDGWSMDVLFRDTLTFYEAYRANRPAVIKPLRIQYKDYSTWALAQVNKKSFRLHRDYWLNKLAGVLPLLELPGAKQRPVIKTYNGKALSTYIGKSTTARLKNYSETNGGSLFMGLLAAWNVLMYHYTGQKDIIIGSPVAGRDHADLEDQIGFYVNMLALRNIINPEESFDAFYRNVKDNTLKSYSHQMYPFDRLVEELDLQRDTSRSAVFDIMLVLQNNGEKKQGIGQISDDFNRIIMVPGYHTSKFDIDISVEEVGDYLSVSVVYNPDVYTLETIQGLITHYKQLLQALIENPAQKIASIDFLTQEEKNQLLINFNNTFVSYPKNETIIDLFEAQVSKTPDKIAVIAEEHELTYRELNEHVNQFANYLRENYAIGADDFVGIKQERSEWMIISVLGVLKSGGAYVPIDLAYPQERIDYIEQDTNCKVCIDEGELDRFRKEQKKYSKENPVSSIRTDDLAYVIYTSGSTGKPKGVLIEHRNVYTFIKWTHDEFKNSNADTVLFTTSLNFDLSVFEIVYTLTTGKELKVLKDGLSIPKNLGKRKKIMINTVPSVVAFLLQQEMSFKTVAVLNMAGEPIPANTRQALKGKVKEIRNLYGPSEDTTYSTFIRIDKDERELIGRPISNTQVYVLNDTLRLVPVGVVGEICIGGDGLARGYLNKRELTEEKFIANPFKSGTRIYKTGDLGRWLPDGNIEFLGRKDDQVKIRGYRIELGEIQQMLQSHANIEAAVVIARENQNKEKELVAYITAPSPQTAAELRSYLKERIPEYMIPTHFVQLDALPLTSNGKVDKKSLPAPQGLELVSGSEYSAPRNETEVQLVKIWEEVLQKDNIGINDDFFVLGGHSLRVIRLRNQYRKKLSANFSLKDLFAHTSIAAHAELIRSPNAATATNSWMFPLSAKKTAQVKNMYFIPPVTGTSILYKPFVEQLGRSFNCYGFQYAGLENEAPLFESIPQAAAEFTRAILQNETNTSVLIFAYSMGASIAFEMVKQLEKNNINVQLVLLDATVKAGAKKRSISRIQQQAQELIEAYKHLITDEHADEAALKKFLVNNFRMHEQYKPEGKIKSDILLFEASKNPVPTDMTKWKKYTAGKVHHFFIEGGHWEMMWNENLPIYKAMIIEHFVPVVPFAEQVSYDEQLIDELNPLEK